MNFSMPFARSFSISAGSMKRAIAELTQPANNIAPITFFFMKSIPFVANDRKVNKVIGD